MTEDIGRSEQSVFREEVRGWMGAITGRLDVMDERLDSVCADTGRIVRAIDGAERPGLIERVTTLEAREPQKSTHDSEPPGSGSGVSLRARVSMKDLKKLLPLVGISGGLGAAVMKALELL